MDSAHLPEHNTQFPNIESYEKRMHVAGFVMWASLTGASVANYSLGEGSYSSSLLEAGAVSFALFSEYLRHSRVKEYKTD